MLHWWSTFDPLSNSEFNARSSVERPVLTQENKKTVGWGMWDVGCGMRHEEHVSWLIPMTVGYQLSWENMNGMECDSWYPIPFIFSHDSWGVPYLVLQSTIYKTQTRLVSSGSLLIKPRKQENCGACGACGACQLINSHDSWYPTVKFHSIHNFPIASEAVRGHWRSWEVGKVKKLKKTTTSVWYYHT